MLQRVVPVVLIVAVLAGLITYSQLRPPANSVSGFVEADEIRLGSRVGGRVARVLAEEGQVVESGQVLVELEPFDLLERQQEASRNVAAREAEYQRLLKGFRVEEIAQRSARYDQLQAKLDLLESGARPEEISAAEARLNAARAERKLAEIVFERNSTLVDRKTVSVEELDRSRQAFESALALQNVRENELQVLRLGAREEEKRSARAALEEAKQAWQLAVHGYRQEEIEEAKAARDAAQAHWAALGRQEQELVIKSPLAGVVDSLDLRPGDMVAAGAPVLSLIDHRRLWVRYVPQDRVGLKVGQRLAVQIDSFPDQNFAGQLAFISQQAEFTPNNVQTPEERSKQVFRIKVVLEETQAAVRPGMTADVVLDPAGGTP